MYDFGRNMVKKKRIATIISDNCRVSIRKHRIVSRRSLCCCINSRYATAAELGKVRKTELNIFHPERGTVSLEGFVNKGFHRNGIENILPGLTSVTQGALPTKVYPERLDEDHSHD